MPSLEREMEQTRERLASTIDELVHRSSPKTIANRQADSVKSFFVDPESGSPRTDNIAKVAGGVAGFIAVLFVIRKLTR
jgi:hypothetical protein